MKTKITSFIMTIITILIIVVFGIIGIIIYNEITKNDLIGEVQEFVSNITIATGEINQTLETSEILNTTLQIEQSNEENIEHTSNNENNYFYNQLEEYSKTIYNELISNKENMKTGVYEIDLGTSFSLLLSENNGGELLGDYYQSAIEAYMYDNPDVFYIEFSKLYLNIETTTRGTQKTYRVFINSGNNSNYFTDEFQTQEEVKTALNEIEKIKDYFVANKSGDTYQNIKMVHDYLIENIEYDQTISLPNIYNLYGALINKKSVCEGYAEAFKYIMDALEIPCIIVSGKATNSEGTTENHAWNYVQLNGVWYVVDCTWDDPILIGSGYLSESSKYRYFLKGSQEINQTHIAEGQFTEEGKVFTFPTISISNY